MEQDIKFTLLARCTAYSDAATSSAVTAVAKVSSGTSTVGWPAAIEAHKAAIFPLKNVANSLAEKLWTEDWSRG